MLHGRVPKAPEASIKASKVRHQQSRAESRVQTLLLPVAASGRKTQRAGKQLRQSSDGTA